MASQRISDVQRRPMGFREGYKGKKLAPGVKLVPVKSPAGDVPVKSGEKGGGNPSK
jgi:hypothetical protein